MITPELIAYIRREFAKGKTREDVHAELIKGGGWSEVDLNEAFRAVIPMQGATQNSNTASSTVFAKSSPSLSPSSSSPTSSSLVRKIILILVVLGMLSFLVWFFRTPLMNLWNFLPFIGESTTLTSPKPQPEANQPSAEAPTLVQEMQTRDCGVSVTPDSDNPATYESDAVLACLGNSARRCEDAKGVLEDDLFPTIFQIFKNQDTCTFQLSYEPDSALLDIKGRSLAGQYISCPINIVKAIDESDPESVIFKAPSIENLSKYASQIYFYGIMGVFVENNVDRNRIQALGCRGEYIDSVIASYNNR